MRYRALTQADDFSRDVATFVKLVGEREYCRLLSNIGKGLNVKGYVTRLDDLRFSLELQLFNLELLRQKESGKFAGIPGDIHEAVDFVIGLGQTIPHLSSAAQKKLRGQIIGGLKTNGLRSVQHELRVASAVSSLGFDVTFFDLEGNGRCDLMAEKDAIVFEIEAKSVPIFSGRPIIPQEAEKFFDEVRRGFNGWTDKDQIPILDVTLKSGLDNNREALLALVDACNAVAGTKTDQTIGDKVAIHFVGTFADAPFERLEIAARLDELRSGVNVYVRREHPKVIIRLRSERRDKFEKNIIATISEASKKQFSGVRPSIIWVHIDYVSPESFKALSYSKEGTSRLDSIANAVFRSSKRDHITQLVFSGGAHLRSDGASRRSNFIRTVYNSPTRRFEKAILFPDGRTRRPTSRKE
jgi:phenylpyruvate tautomerase PptA (4-oxalocrotonate tautomerase family)